MLQFLHHSLSHGHQPQQQQQQQLQQTRSTQRKGLGNKIDPWKGTSGGAVMDLTASLSDEVILKILGILPTSPYPYSQVCKRWLRLQGLLRRSIKVLDWKFLECGRMHRRFPNLTDIDLNLACLSSIPKTPSLNNVIFTNRCLSIHLDLDYFDPSSIQRFIEEQQIPVSRLDKGLKILAESFPDLQRLCVVDVRKPVQVTDFSNSSIEDHANVTKDQEKHVAQDTFYYDDDSEHGLSYIAELCPTVQELELYQCTDESLNAISACKNLQIVKLIGSLSDFYRGTITDIGLTILARNCSRLVKLDLSGCEASYDGISAIGQCCLMLEELTVSNHGFYDGWVAGLSYCSCLKTLRLENCKQIDPSPGPLEHLGHCMALEHLQLVRCNLRDEAGFHALMMISVNIRELEIEDCWGLDDEIFALAAICRRVKLLSLEGCSPLTTHGLEMVVLAYKDIQALKVVYCNNIKDSEITPALAFQFCNLKELRWRPDAKHLLSSSLAGTGIGQQGGKFFKKGGPT